MKTLKDYAKPGAQWAFYKDELSAELLATCIILESELVKDDEATLSDYPAIESFGYVWNATILVGSDEVHKIQCAIDPENESWIWYKLLETVWGPPKFDNCYFMPVEFIDDFVKEMEQFANRVKK